ncbi:MAG: transcription elongation factor GreA [Treponema sp.]|jgi:transcription elongation factor GreA|nr:transcription elongation factor GreA [Treponema sp.]
MMPEVETENGAAENQNTPPLLKKVQEMLNEEKWTRSALSNYSTGNFKDLDLILKESKEKRLDDEIKKLCDEHLIHTKNSIIALYLAGMAALSRQLIDDAAIVNLVTIFVDNHKWNIVKYLCEGILVFGESKFALRTMAACYKNENDEEAVYKIWERLVKVDYEEADLAKSLAEYYEKQGNAENAADYYKKALHRYINKVLFSHIKEIWDKLLQLSPEDIDYFLHVQKRVAKVTSDDKAVELLRSLYHLCIKREDINTAITVLKIILEYDENDRGARKDITECYRKKYAEHSQLEAYIRIASLAQGPRNVMEAVQDFEKHIAFDKGNFVSHRTWGVGKINSVEGDNIYIDFSKKRGNNKMSLKMAVDALQTLTKDHIWVLKALWKKEKLHDKVKEDAVWALKTLIRSFGNSCDFKRIKAELVPQVLSDGEWTAWSANAKEIIRTNTGFGIDPNSIDSYTVRERPIRTEEKLYSEFKAQRDFFDRAATLRSFAALKNAELDTEYFTEMFAYFLGCLKSYAHVNEQVVAAYFLVKEQAVKNPHIAAGVNLNFMEIFNEIEDPGAVFLKLKDTRLKEDFLRHIQLFVPGWDSIYVKIFPRYPMQYIITGLQKGGYEEALVSMTAACFENFRDCREAVVWLFKNSSGEAWYKKANISFEKQLITLIHILNISFRGIENKRETAENRKINKQVYMILFKEGLIDNFMKEANQDMILRIYTFLNDVKEIDPADKLALKTRILERFPDIKFLGEEEKKAQVLGLIVTMAKYEEKQRQLARLMDEEIPANSREIASALELGDLKENAEYKAAKEKQVILNSTIATLNEEIARAQLFDPSTVNTARVSFGTRITLLQLESGNKLEYTILGPWESDPDQGIISYQSPFGKAIYNKTAGEEAVYSPSAGEKVTYKVENISAAL